MVVFLSGGRVGFISGDINSLVGNCDSFLIFLNFR